MLFVEYEGAASASDGLTRFVSNDEEDVDPKSLLRRAHRLLSRAEAVADKADRAGDDRLHMVGGAGVQGRSRALAASMRVGRR
jgi:hypothetical protein